MYNNNGYQQQGGYQQDSRQGLANEYYSEGQGPQYGGNQQNHNQPPPQYQQHNSQYGQQPQHHGGYTSPPPNESYGQRDPEYGAPQNFDGEENSRGFLGAAAGAAVGGYGAYKLAGPATGHNKTSGLVGALGGALSGHVIQDGASHWKDKHDEKKDEEKWEKEHEKQHGGRRDSNERPREGHFAGGFTRSSRDVRLDAHGEYNLHAQCRRADGEWQGSTLSLNRILENEDGSFRWSSGGRSAGGSSEAITVQPGDTLRAIAARHNCDFHELSRHNGIQNEDMIYPGQRLEVPGGGNSAGGGGNFGASARNVRLVEDGQVLEGELRRGGDWVTSRIVLDERIGNKDGCLELV
ncbi:carbohydrate-binding module family 50 protein [Karstenula rhodostoma CBS 690.94]|uniref:Carbohydrate-binding module family 50 protein n=1 Tax=Karstenula rhodostoma CBS 690.94 TaxID=1392251 RepID=A0A9P4PIM0_9PLEO|nr:carbohydrate-binding module family 50 protein [Karstenula rhodostoma CBS 690.94]